MVKFIADIGANHNGDVVRLENLTRTAARIGCWAVKPQIYKYDRLFAGENHITKDWEFKEEWLYLMRNWCDETGMKLGVSVFFEEAVDMANKYVDFFKISSYDVLRESLIKKAIKTKKMVFMSTGMGMGIGSPILLHTVSKYPTPVNEANLHMLKKSYIKGYSDHTRSPGVIYKASNYVEFIEFHLALDGSGYESQTSEHCWMPDKIQEVIFNIAEGEIAMQEHKFDSNYYNQKADPEDGLRPMKQAR